MTCAIMLIVRYRFFVIFFFAEGSGFEGLDEISWFVFRVVDIYLK